MIHSSPFGYAYHRILVDKNGNPIDYEFLDTNDAFGKIIGIPNRQYLNRTFSEALPEAHKASKKWIEICGEIALKGGSTNREDFFPNLGKWFKVQIFSSEKGFFSALFIDITQDRLQLEELEGFFEINLDLLCIADKQANFLKLNKEWENLLGYTIAELLNTKYLKYVHPDDIEATHEQMSKLERNENVTNFVNRYICKNGDIKYIEWRCKPKDNLIYASARDVTQRLLMENELTISEQKFRTLFELLPTGITIADTTGKLLQCNPAAEQILGISAKSIRKRKIDGSEWEIIRLDGTTMPPEEYASVRALKENKPCYGVFMGVVRSKDDIAWIIVNAAPIPNLGVAISYQEFTDLKNLESKLRIREMHLRSIIENQPGIVWLKNINHQFLAVNQLFADATGFNSPDELIGKTDFDIWPKELAEKYRKDDLNVIENKISFNDEELIHYKNEFKIFETFKKPVYDENGNIIGTTGLARDITERKKVEQELRDSEEKYRLISQNTSDGIISFSSDLNVQYVSPAYVKLLGYADEVELNRDMFSFSLVVHPEDREELGKKILTAIQEKKPELKYEYRALHKEGHYIWREDSARFIFDENENFTGAYVVARDITERKIAEQALQLAKEQAEMANQSKSTFLANMSHEIRTPLHGVIGFTDLLIQTPLNDIQRQYAENANASGKALLGIINDILDFSKIEAGKLELDEIYTDIQILLEQTMDIIKYQAASKGIELLLNVAPGIPRQLKIDPIRLKQILLNLLTNAVKFTETGEVELIVEYKETKKHRLEIKFSIRDTGIGISKNQQSKLFQAFSQADNSTTRKYGGTGLGLIISSLLVEKMGGKIDLESEYGCGSTFYFTFETIYSNKSEQFQVKDLIVKKVLIVDDNNRNRKILEDNFYHWGIDSYSCETGLEAIKILETTQVELILIDYNMPFLNGLETIRAIRKIPNLIKETCSIVLLHSNADDKIIQDGCKELNVILSLVKPVKATELLSFITNLHNTPIEKELTPSKMEDTSWAMKPNHNPGNILIAEDVPINMILVKAIVHKLRPNLRILEAINGNEVLEIFNKEKIDLVLMDVQMPILDGLDATKLIRQLEKNSEQHVPIIALTAGALKEEKAKAIESGMDDFITKPIEIEKLKDIFKRFLDTDSTDLV